MGALDSLIAVGIIGTLILIIMSKIMKKPIRQIIDEFFLWMETEPGEKMPVTNFNFQPKPERKGFRFRINLNKVKDNEKWMMKSKLNK